jgi:hypothetical protein
MNRWARARSCLAGSLPEQLVRLSCLGKRKSLSDERLDPLLSKEVKQGDQILSKRCRPKPFEPLDATWNHPFPARETQPSAMYKPKMAIPRKR